jgi:hypothetical protein
VGGIDLGVSPGEFHGVSGTANTYFYNFGNVTTVQQSLTVTNEGEGTTKPLYFDQTPQEGFKLHGGTCVNTSLAPGKSCTVELTYEVPALCIEGRGEMPIESLPTERYVYAELEVFATCP